MRCWRNRRAGCRSLLLVAHGVREEVAATLGEEEKRDLWAALRAALHQLRNPSFDNPQLRVRDEGA